MQSKILLLVSLVFFAVDQAPAQNSAPSSHLVFDDRFDGDLLIHQVRVPKKGETLYTYYETLGWRGKAAGYAGIQSHPRGRNFIFSIWDHQDHSGPIRPVYRGPGTLTEGFGGEGTGLKSWNFELGWDTDQWYTLVARCWPVKDHTHFGFWVYSPPTGTWTHLVTMDVATENARFRGGTDAFIEDWLATGKNLREVHYKGGWKRRLSGEWYPFQAARYSVNSWDLEQGKRSYNFRSNWNGGVSGEAKKAYYFMQSGGANTSPKVKNPSIHDLKRMEKIPVSKPVRISKSTVRRDRSNNLILQWEIDKKSSPQFSYRIDLKVDGKEKGKVPPKSFAQNSPHARSHRIQLSEDERKLPWELSLSCSDVFGGTSNDKVLIIPAAE